jgi:hypothetical protein
MVRSLPIRIALLAVLAADAGLAQAQTRAALEPAPSLPGSDLARPALLKGPHHKVAEPVRVEGHLGRFVIESKFGKFSIAGNSLLAVRVHELQAIEELLKVRKDGAFTDALAKSGGGVAKFAESAVTDPGKTAENIGKGASTVFGRIGYLAKSGADYVSDKASDVASGSSAPKGKPAPGGEPEPPSFTGDPFGYNQARREWAKKLGIDPYTSNPVLRPLLDDAASATFAGNFAVSLTLGAIVAPVQYAYEFDDTTRQSVWNKPAIDLEKENQAKLVRLGVPERTVRDLLRNRWFTPTLQTALVTRLEQFGRLEGIAQVVRAASATQGEARARFLLDSLAMLAGHHQKEAKLAKLRMSNLVPAGVAADGRVVAAVAIDYGTWDKDAAAFAQRKELAAKSRTLLVAGKLSPRAKQELEKAGWSVKPGLRT